jgi:hypothetical protein
MSARADCQSELYYFQNSANDCYDYGNLKSADALEPFGVCKFSVLLYILIDFVFQAIEFSLFPNSSS